MREIRSSGSVRGVRSDPYPNRDTPKSDAVGSVLFGMLAGTRILRLNTDSKAAPVGGLRLGLLALRCSSFAPAEPIQKDFASDEEPYD